MTMLLLHLLALSVFITIFIFLDAYNVHKPSNKNFAPVKTKPVAEQKNAQQLWIKVDSLSKPVVVNFLFWYTMLNLLDNLYTPAMR